MTTWIAAPVERCFRLSLSLELHLDSIRRERIVEGKPGGLLLQGETVTWTGRHFGVRLRHQTVIDGWRPFSFFRDSMVRGAFRSFAHEHHFAAMDDGTRLRDEVRFSMPLGPLGRMAEGRVRAHLTRLLQRRNAYLKRVAETAEWHKYLDGQPAIERG